MKVFLQIISVTILLIFGTTQIYGQESIAGIWKTIDHDSGEERSQMKIYEKDGVFYGRVVKMYPSATIKTCQGCKGDLKDKSLLDIDIIWGLKPYKNYYSYGTFIDPKSGREFSLNITRKGDKLKVRGYIGVPMIGKTQTWYLIEEF